VSSAVSSITSSASSPIGSVEAGRPSSDSSQSS
jgi:hypothetical protein